MSARFYRSLMFLLLPADVRRRYGFDMSVLFAARLRESSGSVVELARLWAQAIWDLLRHGSAQRFGPPEGRYPEVRRRGWIGWLAAIARDARFGARMLRANPLFTTVAVLTLALGIGANTAMFSVINAVFLSPLPFPESERLVKIKRFDLGEGTLGSVTSPANFADWRERARSFESIAALSDDTAALIGPTENRRLRGVRSAGSVLEVLGVPPLFGRAISRADDDNGDAVVVLSHGLWQSLFGEERDVLGTTLDLDGVGHTIVGVMPADFASRAFAGVEIDFWSTSRWSAEYRRNETNYAHEVVARLAGGVSLAQAQGEMAAIAAQLRDERPETNRDHGVRLVPMHNDLVGDSTRALYSLMGAVGVLLLIAAVNLANLLMARTSAREQEIAVRKALGATKTQLAVQVLTESLLLGLLGGGAGLLLAYGGLDLIVALIPWDAPGLERVALDARVLGFTFAAATVTGLAFGVLPALRLAGTGAAARLRASARTTGTNVGSWNALVVVEVALAVVLLTSAGLLLRTFVNLSRVDPGFRSENVLTFVVAMPDGQNPDVRLAAWAELETSLASLPGVTRVARANQLPAEANRVSGWFNFIDRPVDDPDRSFLVPYRLVSADYFETLGINLVEGRTFRDSGNPAEAEAVVNEAARRRFWGHDSPLGDVIGIGNLAGRLFFPAGPVVGVVADVHNDGIDSDPIPAVYYPARFASGWSNLTFAVHTAADADLIPAVRQRLRQIEPTATVFGVETVAAMLAAQLAPTRGLLWLIGSFALLGLLMAGIGVFGLLSFSVSRRTAEMGIRVALGANGASLTRMVVGQALWRVAIGTGIGIPAALAAAQLLESLLFGVSATDPLTVAAVCAVLALIATAASYLPARRAARADPTTALRAS